MASLLSGSLLSGYVGELCQMPGNYRSFCIHSYRTRLEEEHIFPDCPGRNTQGYGSDTLLGLYWHRGED